MAASFGNYLENKILDHIFKTAPYTQPVNIRIALSTADPGESGSGLAEPSGNNYARVTMNTWAAASNGSTSNSAVITFPTASGSWGTITHLAILDESANLLAYGALGTAKAVTNGDILRLDIGTLVITLD